MDYDKLKDSIDKGSTIRIPSNIHQELLHVHQLNYRGWGFPIAPAKSYLKYKLQGFAPLQRAHLAKKAAEMVRHHYEIFAAEHLPYEHDACTNALNTIEARMNGDICEQEVHDVTNHIRGIKAELYEIRAGPLFEQTRIATLAMNALESVELTCYTTIAGGAYYPLQAILKAADAHTCAIPFLERDGREEAFLDSWWKRCVCMLAFDNVYRAELE